MFKRTIYHVALPGCGKTEWLCEKAYEAYLTGHKCYLITHVTQPREYESFCNRWMNKYNSVCPVQAVTSIYDIPTPIENVCVFNDNIKKLAYEDFVGMDKVTLYATINGEVE